MNIVTVTLGTLVDRALEELRSQYEVGRPVVRSDALDPEDSQFTLNVTNVNIGDIIEWPDGELNLVTAKTTGGTPTYTVYRGWDNTSANARDPNEVGYLNPTFSRKAAAAGVKRSLSCIESAGVFLLKTEDYSAVADPFDDSTGVLVLEVPEDTRDVWYVRHGLENVPRWRYLDTVSTTTYDTGRVVVLPYGWDSTWTAAVTRLVPYRWDSYPDEPDEESEIELPEGAEFLPSTYATAWVISGREVSRTEIDRSEEWNRSEPARGGVSQSVVRDKWQQFYRKLDEVRRLDPPMPTRPFVPMTR